ncbi:MAG: hypothetical protein H6622_10565 [Halobacteriovoraceae bacterium]|nr:hypothetical protein [Halobacteriovoraceae bacterium]
MNFFKITLLSTLLFTNGLFSQESNTEIKANENKIPENISKKTIARPAPSINGLQVHSLGIGLGQTFLKGDFGRNGEDSITIDIYHNYSASYSFDFLSNIHLSKHTYGNHHTVIPGIAFAIKSKFFQFDNFSPYALGGLGFYRPYVKDELGRSEAKTRFGANFGLGVELKLNNRMTTGIIGHYHNPFDTKQFGRPEIDGSYFKLLLTALYSFSGF